MKKFILLILIAILTFTMSACDSETNTSANNSGVNTTNDSQQNNEIEQSENTNLAIGETATLGDWEISVTDFSFTTKIDVNQYLYFTPDEGNQYAIVSLSVTNNAKESDTFLPSFSTTSDVHAKICYGDGYEYSSSYLIGYDKDLHDSSMNPLTSKEGVIIFPVPDLVANSEDELLLILSQGNKEIIFTLR